MSHSRSRIASPRTARKHLRKWAAILLVATICAVAFSWYRDHPRRLLQSARTMVRKNPAKADALFEQSILAAGGHFPEAQLERCVLFAEQHRWLEATGCFSQIVDPFQCDDAQLLRLAKLALAERIDYLAEPALATARKTGKVEADALRLLIPMNLRLERTENVLVDCARLSELDRIDPMPWLVTGRIHSKNGRVAEAIDAFQNAQQRKLNDADLNESRNDLAELYLHDGNLPACRQQLEQLRAAREPTPSDRLKWSYLLRLEGDFEGALEEVEAVLGRMPDHVKAQELRGTLKLDCGRPEEAITDLRRTLELDPYSVEAHNKIGQAYQAVRQSNLAALHLRRSRELYGLRTKLLDVQAELKKDPDNAALQRQAADLRTALGNPHQ